jgi:tripartite-type tricarboxylate transporter receptor subunit TctC
MRALFLFLGLVLFTTTPQGQEWPAKAVRIVVPFPPGGGADAIPRIVADKLASRWNQPFVVENRAGATGTIGAELVFRAEADGYTLLSTPPAPLVINPSLYRKLPYDPSQFVPVAVMASIPSVLLVNPRLGTGSVAEFVSLVKSNPGKFNYASQGSTSVSFLTTELFMAVAGGAAGALKITHVPYKGTGPALPDVPAMNEIYPGFVSVAWFGIVAPPRTPPAVAERISASIREVLALPEVQRRLGELSAETIGMPSADMARFMQEETERWRSAIRTAGVKPGEL